MEYTKLIIEKQEDICIVKINNPQAMNALNSTVLSELDCAFSQIESDQTIKVVILTGEGRAFVAGADISQMSTMSAAEGKAFGEQGAAVFRKIEQLKVPVIAAVNGFALGGGCELAMACDIRIASAKAKFGQPEVGLGITPGFSGTQRLPRLVGMGVAKELIYTADIIGADEAYRIGLVNKVAEPEALMDQAIEMAKKIASKAPIAVRYSKEAINRGCQVDIDTAIAIEANLFGLCFASEDQKEGMSSFLNKKAPEFKNK
jgi:enoyl-CoA hydratase